MIADEIVEKIDIKEPLLVEWILDRIREGKEADDTSALEIEARIFDDESIRYIIKNYDVSFLTRVFHIVSPARFSNNLDLLTEIWLENENRPTYEAANVIAKAAPDVAADLFEDYCKQSRNLHKNMQKYLAVLHHLMDLRDDRARAIARMILDAHLELPDEHEAESSFFPMIFQLAWSFDLPEFDALFRKELTRVPTSGDIDYADIIRKPAIVLDVSIEAFRLVRAVLEERERPALEDLDPFYEKTAPLETMFNAIERLKDGTCAFFPSFFEKYGGTIRDGRVRTLFRDLLHDRDFIAALRDDKHKSYVYAMMVAGILTFTKKDKMDLSRASMDEVIRLLSTDIETMPDIDSFVAFFKSREKSVVVRSLTGALVSASDHYGGTHILDVMGALGFDEFIEPMADAMSVGVMHSFIAEDAGLMLQTYGDRAIDILIEYVDRMEEDVKTLALAVVTKTGGPGAIRFIDRHFDEYWKLDREYLMSVCETLRYDKRLEKLEPKLGKEQRAVEKTYLTLTLLKGKKTSRIEKLLKKYYEDRNERRHFGNQAERIILQDSPLPFYEAELICNNCQDPNFYRLEQIYISSKGNYFIAQEIECIHCHMLSDFEFTFKAKAALHIELLRFKFLNSDKNLTEAGEGGPFQFYDTYYLGEKMGIDELVNRYRREIEKKPRAAHNYIGLGNSYTHMEMPMRARECFTTALELDSAYIQAYVGLARIADESGNPQKAMALMVGGRRFLHSPKYWRGSGIDRDGFIKQYCEYYNSLSDETGLHVPHLNPGSIMKKTGQD